MLFAVLWSSASVATKFGLHSAQPLVIAVTRFAVAAAILLFIAHGIQRNRLPRGGEWRQIAVYGFLNISLYLGLYVVSMQHLTAGISALAVATNPVFISLLAFISGKQKWTRSLVLSLLVCSVGVLCAAWPLLQTAAVTSMGLLLILLSMISYSAGALYFSSKDWNDLTLLTINGWQTAIGGLGVLPFAIATYHSQLNHFDNIFWWSVLWLAIPVSVGAVQLWLILLKKNPVKASLWLFLCPLSGFMMSGWLLKEPITYLTIAGIVLVICGLLLSRMKNGSPEGAVEEN